MDEIAEKYLNNDLNDVEVRLVLIVMYNETRKLTINSKEEIKKQIEEIIEERYKKFDNDCIDIVNNPILQRITYIVFPIWDLKRLAEAFQKLV